jgi:hypothetical protein
LSMKENAQMLRQTPCLELLLAGARQ